MVVIESCHFTYIEDFTKRNHQWKDFRKRERAQFIWSLINTTQSLTGKLIVFLSHDSHELGGICLILMQVWLNKYGREMTADKSQQCSLTDIMWWLLGKNDRDRRQQRENGAEEVSVLQGREGKLVCRKLRWCGTDSDRCSMCWCLKRDHGVQIL